MMLRLLLPAFLLALPGCAERMSSTPLQEPIRYPKLGIPMKDGQPDLTNVFLTFERTRCFGFCPEYEVLLFGNGTGYYKGGKHVATTGLVKLFFDPNELGPVLGVLEDLDFLNTNNACGYRDETGDSPSAALVLNVNGRAASFTSDVPCPFTQIDPAHLAMHTRVQEAVAAIERTAGIERLVGSVEEAFERRARESLGAR
jgi:hypothetical protein